MRLQMSIVSPMDCDMLAHKVTREDFLYYRKNTAGFKQMWEDQGTLFWRHLVMSFIYHTVNSAGNGPAPAPDLPGHKMKGDVSSGWNLWMSLLDEACTYLISDFAQGPFNNARTILKDGCTLSEFGYMVEDISRSRSKDPFYHKNTREVYRRLYGEPGVTSAIKATMLYSCYTAFSGALVFLMRRWLSLARITTIVTGQTPGDIRGMCMLQLLLDGVISTSENMRYMERIIRRRLHLPEESGVDAAATLPKDAKAVEQAVRSVFTQPLAAHALTPVLARIIDERASTHPAERCSVCRDKVALLTRVGGSMAGGKEITLKVSTVCHEARPEHAGKCRGDCGAFKYRTTVLLEYCLDTCIDTMWTNYSFRCDTLMARLKPCENFPPRSQTSLVFLMRCQLEGQIISYKNWTGKIDTLPFIRRVWQLTRAFCELLYETVASVEEAVDDFSAACEDVQRLLQRESFDAEDGERLREFVACVGVAYSSLAHPLCFAWTLCGVPDDSSTLLDTEHVVRKLCRSLVAASAAVDLTADGDDAAAARRTCCSVAVALRLVAAHITDMWPIAYRLVSVLQTTCLLVEDADTAIAAQAVIKEACQTVDKELVRDIVNRPLVGKSVMALLASVRRFEADLRKLSVGGGKLAAASAAVAVAEGSAGTCDVVDVRPHTCSFRDGRLEKLVRRGRNYEHEEHRHFARRKMESYATTPAVLVAPCDRPPTPPLGAAAMAAVAAAGSGATKSSRAAKSSISVSPPAEVDSDGDSSDTAAMERDYLKNEESLRKMVRASKGIVDDEQDGGGADQVPGESACRRAQYILEMEERAVQGRPLRFVKDHELAEFDRDIKARHRRRRRMEYLDEDDGADDREVDRRRSSGSSSMHGVDEAALRPDQRPRVDYDELSRSNFTFDGFNTLRNSPTCTAKDKSASNSGPTGTGPTSGRVNIDVSLKRLNPTAFKARQQYSLSEYVPLYSGHCSCSSPFCLKCVNPLVAPGVVDYGHKDGLQQSKRRSSKSERARRKEELRLSKAKKKPSVQGKRPAAQDKDKDKDKDKAAHRLAIKAKADVITEDKECRKEPSEASSPATVVTSLESEVDKNGGSDPALDGDGDAVRTTSGEQAADSVSGGVSASVALGVDGSAAVNGSAAGSEDSTGDDKRCVDATNDVARVVSSGGGRVNGDSETSDEATSSSSLASTDESGLSGRKSRLNTCACCGTTEPRRKTYKKCNRCTNPHTTRYYCSRDCQALDWKARHRREHTEDTL